MLFEEPNDQVRSRLTVEVIREVAQPDFVTLSHGIGKPLQAGQGLYLRRLVTAPAFGNELFLTRAQILRQGGMRRDRTAPTLARCPQRHCDQPGTDVIEFTPAALPLQDHCQRRKRIAMIRLQRQGTPQHSLSLRGLLSPQQDIAVGC